LSADLKIGNRTGGDDVVDVAVFVAEWRGLDAGDVVGEQNSAVIAVGRVVIAVGQAP